MRRHTLVVCLCVGWVVSSTGMVGAEPAQVALSEQDFFGEVPVVLSVSRLMQPVSEAPAAVTVIDRDMIRTSGFRDLADVFRLVPGFYVGHFTGNEQVVSNGLNNRYFGRVQVLLDGMSVYTPMFGQVPWSALPLALEDIERIEVTRGPNAASHGANSFLGIINIITRDPVQDRGSLLAVRGGAPALADAVARHGGKAGGWDYRLTVGHKQDHGFELRNDRQRTDFISGRGDYRIDEQNTLQVQAGYTGALFGRGYFDSNLDVPHDQRVQSSYQQLHWRRVYGPDDEMSLQFYHTANSGHEAVTTTPYVESGVPILATFLRNDLDSERFDIEFQRNQRLSPALRVVWGGSSRLDRVRAPLYLNATTTKTSKLQRVFLNGEWRPAANWVVNGGAMWEHNDITGTDLSPRLALSYHMAPGHTVRGGVSRALRTPTVLEDSGDYNLTLNIGVAPGSATIPYFKGGQGLRPESIVSRELSYLFESAAHGFSADTRLFVDRIQDTIAPVSTAGVPYSFFLFRNAADVTMKGVQTQARWRTGATQIALSHAYTKTVIESAYNTNVAEDLQKSNPSHIGSALVSHHFGSGIEASVGYYQVSEMHPIGDGQFLKHYRRWDARLAYDFRVGAQRGQLALVMQNLFAPYSEFRRENEFKSRTFGTLSLEF
ncbi:MAG: TonB-dependent receptor [Burkholderiales bacterium]|nr:TonB-dependent receptor [Burkholderiales bacterium]